MQIIIKVMSDEGVLLEKCECLSFETAEEALGKMARRQEELKELEVDTIREQELRWGEERKDEDEEIIG